jgi:rRNA maturation RNase YbeY
MASKSKVYFFFDNVSINLRERTRLKALVEGIFKKEKKRLATLNYIFCSDRALLRINQEYLEHDFYTDIITFDLSESPGEIAGEIYISVDRVRDNARQHKISFQSELLRVIFHGALHLCGFDDKTEKDKSLMRDRENYYLTVSRDTVSG